jgi:hypothetical protein
LHDLAKNSDAAPTRTVDRGQRVLGRLFENLDGGEELGLGPLLMLEPDGDKARADILRECATFRKALPNYIPALGEAVDAILKAHGGWCRPAQYQKRW